MEQRETVKNNGHTALTERYELEVKLLSGISRFFNHVKSIEHNSMDHGDHIAALIPEGNEQPLARSMAEFLAKELT